MRRLDQILAGLGYGSRSDARRLVASGAVTVGGEAAVDAGMKADPASVRVSGEPLDHPGGLLLMMNKPAGLVCSHADSEGPSVYGLLPERWRRRNPAVTSVGRLDKDTTGLLLLTDLSAVVHALTSPRRKVPKVYRAAVDSDLPAGLDALFSSGTLVLEGETQACAPARLAQLGPREAELTLTEGKYHQVKRMFASQGCRVTRLHRSQFGSLRLGELAPGSWMQLDTNILGTI
ncbi:MAG TPA: pseudouridine synthase [Opitutaceae bacterium]|jgi:16S rRNA pseudouridine516 synthase